MADGPLYRVAFRRRREGRTDYRTRLALLKGEKPRLVVRRSLRNVTVQFVTYDEAGDRVVAQATASELKELGWTGYTANTPAAYLTGLLAGTRFLAARSPAEGASADDAHALLDLGRQVPVKGGRAFAALAGAIEAGVKVPHGSTILPTDDRIRGEHVRKDGQPVDFAAAFAATFQKIAGRAPPAKKEAKKPKGGKGPAAPAAPAGKGQPPKGPKPAAGEKKPASPKGSDEKKAKTPK